ncbi:MAG TPA: class E sortase [Acidimicrobiales bacterium]|nr:class E sortase [Acidimicrobiales bacterium]
MRAAGIIGRILIGGGIILLLFTAYQVWGTSFQEARTQTALRSALEREAQNAQVRRALAEAIALDKLPTGPPVAAATTSAPAEGKAVGEIRIPAISINQVVVEGTNTGDLRKGPGHYIGTPLPGQVGNAAIAGHRTTYGHPFYNLNVLKVGNPVVMTTIQGIFVYDVTRTQVVSPSDGAVIDNFPGVHLTLTTCNPRFSASTRLVVTAVLAHSQLFPNSGLPPARAGKPKSGDLAGTSSGQIMDAALWGALVAIAGAVVLLLAHRYRRRRWAIYIAGAAGDLVLLYIFFGAISPLLPASF